jgi:ABC-type sugar transport system ATPase subunit
MAASTKIKIENVSKKYDVENKALLFTKGNSAHDNFVGRETAYVLRNVNLEIKEGEFRIFLGASGCGKTTLLNIIAGFLHKTDGSVKLDDKEIQETDSGKRCGKSCRCPFPPCCSREFSGCFPRALSDQSLPGCLRSADH